LRISHQYRFIFFANPKTGSSSVRQMLNLYSDMASVKNYLACTAENPFYPHMPPSEARPLFVERGWGFGSYQKFVFVRNPWSRLVSLYEHIVAGDATVRPFNQWIYSVTPSGQGGGGEAWIKWRRFGTYSIKNYTHDDNGKCLIDQVLRLEDIEHALPRYLRQLGLPQVDKVQLLHCNQRTQAGQYQAYYNDKTAAHVARLYQYDIETYKYRFGD